MTTLLHATCQTDGCAERGVDKPVHIDLFPGDDEHEAEVVTCGECGHPCSLAELPVADTSVVESAVVAAGSVAGFPSVTPS